MAHMEMFSSKAPADVAGWCPQASVGACHPTRSSPLQRTCSHRTPASLCTRGVRSPGSHPPVCLLTDTSTCLLFHILSTGKNRPCHTFREERRSHFPRSLFRNIKWSPDCHLNPSPRTSHWDPQGLYPWVWLYNAREGMHFLSDKMPPQVMGTQLRIKPV